MVAEHVVRIGQLDARLRTLGVAASAAPVLADALSGRLVDLLPGLLEPVLDAHDGVIRIRTLSLHLAGEGFGDPRRLADLLAAAIARGVGQALNGHHPPIMAWPTRAGYLAHYLQHRLGLRRAPGWCFEELHALEELTPVQALIQLAGDEPEVLRVLAQDDPRASMLGRLDGQDCRELLARLLQRPPTAPLLPRLTSAQLAARVRHTTPGVLARHTLQLLFSALLRHPAQDRINPVALLPAVMAVVALAALLEQDPSPATARVPHPADLFESQLLRVSTLPPAYRTALRQVAASPVLHQLLQRQLRLVNTPVDPMPREPGPSPEPTRAAESAIYHSPWAGCALLLPVLCAHGFDRFLDPGQLHRVLIDTLDPHVRDEARADALLRRLFDPATDLGTPREVRQGTDQSRWPGIPATLAAQVHPDSRALAEPGAAQRWSGLLLALFASRLPGLRGSSAGYLRRQFLAVSGTLTVTAAGLHVELAGPDLAVVLAMAGFNGPQRPLPWLAGLGLELDLGGLHP